MVISHIAYDTFYSKVKTLLIANKKYDVKVAPYLPKAQNCIVITERDNSLRKRDNMNVVRESSVIIQCEVFTKDTLVGNNTLSRKTIFREIEEKIMQVAEELGFRIILSRDIPNLDEDYFRHIYRFACTQIDTKNVII